MTSDKSKSRKKPKEAEPASAGDTTALPNAEADLSSARLLKLTIRNLGCIGSTAVSIDLDDIVVLVGENNVGKSTILRAYELVMLDSPKKLSIEDFPNRVLPRSEDEFPSIEIETEIHAVRGNVSGDYLCPLPTGGYRVRERWMWEEPDKEPVRSGWKWEKKIYEGQPSGFAAKANARRPKPYRLTPFSPVEEQSGQVLKLFMAAVEKQAKIKSKEESEFESLKAQLSEVRKKLLSQFDKDISEIEKELTQAVQAVFPGQRVEIDRDPDPMALDASILFKNSGPVLRMGEGDVLTTLERQGSGSQRALMWAALQVLAQRSSDKKDRPRVLLIDEPEMCLHPSSIRAARKSLYDLAENAGWQLMVTTHSPHFVDLTRDHTTIVRVERSKDSVRAVRVFRSADPAFVSHRDEIKLLNAYDPTVGEFFFGGRTIVVEGDTEYAAFQRILSACPDLADVHVVRARGKSNILLISTILNQFKARYAVLHDADRPRCRDGRINGMWTINADILKETNRPDVIRVASVTNFEVALFGKEVFENKPSEALAKLEEPELRSRLEVVVRCLVGAQPLQDLPPGFVAWTSLEELEKRVAEVVSPRSESELSNVVA